LSQVKARGPAPDMLSTGQVFGLRRMEQKLVEQDDCRERVPACPSCGGVMRLVHIVPRLGTHPELRSFRCSDCDEVVTRADD
jgi:hypothetical protein